MGASPKPRRGVWRGALGRSDRSAGQRHHGGGTRTGAAGDGPPPGPRTTAPPFKACASIMVVSIMVVAT
jgi:hypothetical protein